MLLKSFSILLSALLGSITAIPSTPRRDAPGLVSPPENTTCVLWNNFGIFLEWGAFVPLKSGGPDGRATINTTTGECGLAVLDGLRDYCGAITHWQCDPIDRTGRLLANFHDTAAVGAVMNFNTINLCFESAIQRAVEQATHGPELNCGRRLPDCPPQCGGG